MTIWEQEPSDAPTPSSRDAMPSLAASIRDRHGTAEPFSLRQLHELCNSPVEARKEIGEDAVPFHQFADVVKSQVKKLPSEGHTEVAFRVAVKDGKVNFTARATKG